MMISLSLPTHAWGNSWGISIYPSNDQPVSATQLRSKAQQALRAHKTLLIDAFAEAEKTLLQETNVDANTALFARVERDSKEAWRNYLEGRTSFAAKRFSELRDDAVALAGSEAGHLLIAELSLRLGVTRLELNQLAEASDDFRLAQTLAPNRVVDDNEFKPEVVQSYQTAIAAPLAIQKRELSLQPANAIVVVDGRSAQAGVLELGDGLHIVVVNAPGYSQYTQILSVALGGDAPVVVKLEEDPVAMAVLRGPSAVGLGATQGSAGLYLQGVVRHSSANGVLLMSSVWRQEQPALLGQLCQGADTRCSSVVEIGYIEGDLDKAMVALIGALIQSEKRFPPSLQSDARVLTSAGRPSVIDPKSTPLWKNKWLWLGVAGVSAAATAAYLFRGEDTVSPVFTGNSCDFGGC